MLLVANGKQLKHSRAIKEGTQRDITNSDRLGMKTKVIGASNMKETPNVASVLVLMRKAICTQTHTDRKIS